MERYNKLPDAVIDWRSFLVDIKVYLWTMHARRISIRNIVGPVIEEAKQWGDIPKLLQQVEFGIKWYDKF